jgi:nucleotide-binding universal stress UspA family protein
VPDKPRILIAYDGSELSRTAVRQAASLFPGSPAVVVTVWEPGLGALVTMSPGFDNAGPFPARYDPELMQEVDRAGEHHADRLAREGAELATSLGLEAEAHAIADELRVGETIAEVAEKRDAAAVVTGSRGRGGFRSHLLGSTSRAILGHCARPVVVVRAEEPEH